MLMTLWLLWIKLFAILWLESEEKNAARWNRISDSYTEEAGHIKTLVNYKVVTVQETVHPERTMLNSTV